MSARSARKELNELLRHRAIWRAGARTEVAGSFLATGWSSLDTQLPGGGWPQGALTELLTDASGSGEVSLLTPALAALSQRQHWIAWINTPWIPFPPVLAARGLDLKRVLTIRSKEAAEIFWAAEQLLTAKELGAVLLWTDQANERGLRRLQLAAESTQSCVFVFRPAAHVQHSSPAALRLVVKATSKGSQVDVLKCRGRRPSQPLLVA